MSYQGDLLPTKTHETPKLNANLMCSTFILGRSYPMEGTPRLPNVASYGHFLKSPINCTNWGHMPYPMVSQVNIWTIINPFQGRLVLEVRRTPRAKGTLARQWARACGLWHSTGCWWLLASPWRLVQVISFDPRNCTVLAGTSTWTPKYVKEWPITTIENQKDYRFTYFWGLGRDH